MKQDKGNGIKERITQKFRKVSAVKISGIILTIVGILACVIALIFDATDRPYWKWFLVWAEIFENGKNSPEGEEVLALMLAVWAVIMGMIQYILTRMDSTIFGINMGKIIAWLFGESELFFLMTVFYTFVPVLFIGWFLKRTVLMAMLLILLIIVLWYVAWLISALDDEFIYAVVLKKSENAIKECVRDNAWESLNQIEIEKLPIMEMIGSFTYLNMGESEKAILAIKFMEKLIMENHQVKNHKVIVLLLNKACMTAEIQSKRGIWFLMNYVTWNNRNYESCKTESMAVLIAGIELILREDEKIINEWLRLFQLVSKGRRKMAMIISLEYVLYLLDAGDDGRKLWKIVEKLIKEYGKEYLYIEEGIENILYRYWIEWHRTDAAYEARLQVIDRMIEILRWKER